MAARMASLIGGSALRPPPSPASLRSSIPDFPAFSASSLSPTLPAPALGFSAPMRAGPLVSIPRRDMAPITDLVPPELRLSPSGDAVPRQTQGGAVVSAIIRNSLGKAPKSPKPRLACQSSAFRHANRCHSIVLENFCCSGRQCHSSITGFFAEAMLVGSRLHLPQGSIPLPILAKLAVLFPMWTPVCCCCHLSAIPH